MIRVNDIEATQKFMDDWANAPPKIRRTVDKIIRMTLDANQFPPSFSVHMARLDGGVRGWWIGHVTRTRSHWRILFTYQDNGVACFEHLVTKSDERDLLR